MHSALKHIGIPILLAGAAFGIYHHFTSMRHADLVVFTKQRSVHFNVEIAATPEQETQGLMGRTSLAADAGMLFPIPDKNIIWMWMKNTQMSVDMIFIGEDQRITKIVPHNKPLDETPIMSDGPVLAVLEIADGMALMNQIDVGDKVDWVK